MSFIITLLFLFFAHENTFIFLIHDLSICCSVILQQQDP